MWTDSAWVSGHLSTGWVQDADICHYAVAGVCFVGTLMAIFNEDISMGSVRWSWLTTDFLPIPSISLSTKTDVEHTVTGNAGKKTNMQNNKNSNSSSNINSNCVNNSFHPKNDGMNQSLGDRCKKTFWMQIVDAYNAGGLVAFLQGKWSSKFQKLCLILTILRDRARTSNKRLLQYVTQKRVLGLPVGPNEQEFEAYVSVKRHMKSKREWPFMLQVDSVKTPQVICDNRVAVPMSSYSYLDLLRCNEVQEAAIEAARQYSTGNHGPRMLGGNLTIITKLEESIAQFFGRESCLVVATGYLAVMSSMVAVLGQSDLAIVDARAHASLRAGLKLSGAKVILFRHNDYHQCEKLVMRNRNKYRNCWLVIESVYSMDGDLADLPRATEICSKYNMKMCIDEAHGLGVLGKTGRGLEEHYNMPLAADMIVGTFSKSVAGVGGYIVADRDLIDYMDFHAPGNVFSAALTAYSAGGALKAFELINRDQWRIQKAQENSSYLRNALIAISGMNDPSVPEDEAFEVEGEGSTPVIPVVFRGDVARVLSIANWLLDRGWMVSAVVYPACPQSGPRFRITGTSAYDKDLMDGFVSAIAQAVREIKPTPSVFS